MASAALSSLLPAPRGADRSPYDASAGSARASSGSSSTMTVAAPTSIPPYGQRRTWRPQKQADFGDGGAYPECHLAQYPLEMGRKKSSASGSTLSLQVDEDGNVQYDAIVKQGRQKGQFVQSSHKDLIPLAQRGDKKDAARSMDRPDAALVAETAERTRLALEKITQGKIKTAQPTHVPESGGNSQFIRYTPGAQGGDGSKQRIIKMTEVVEDPLEPPRWKHKKGPTAPPSPPPPVLRSPPRKITAQDQKDWAIPPCISNWKNNKGYTIQLDKRLAADGRGLQDVHINDGFAQFSEALHLADRHAREEVRQRSQMQQKLAAKEKAAREDHLRELAQRARDERAGIAPAASSSAAGPSSSVPAGRPTASNVTAALAGYGSDSDSDDSEDEEEAKERDRLREERRRERERDMRMSNMGTEQRAKMLAREQNRDISEKVALGLAKPTAAGGQVDSRLFDRETLGTFGAEDSGALYDKPLFSGSSAAAAIYGRPTGSGNADDIYGGGTAEGVEEEVGKNDRFNLGVGRSKAFQGAEYTETRSGPVQFEKDVAASAASAAASGAKVEADPFAIDQFLDEAKRGVKRPGLDKETSASRKRQKEDE